MGMSTDAVAILGFIALFTLMLLRVPVGMAMGLVGVSGFSYLVGGTPALKLVGQTSMRTVTDYTFGVIPMFLLMGTFVSNSGMSRELFRAANGFVGHLRGGLGIATVAACGGFAAICGSSVATAATFSAVAYPEMRRFGYPQSFATGVTEAGGVGATGAFLIGVLTGRLDKDKILASLLQATRTAAAVFTVLIGALIFGYFLTVTQTPQKVTEFLTGLGLGSYGVLALIMVMYLVLGCLMDAMAMIILTVPIIFPVVTHLGFDPIWFGVIIVMTVELGLIHPPVGMNIFVIKSVIEDVKISTIFYGVLPFIVTDLLRLAILIAFPILALWLPSRM